MRRRQFVVLLAQGTGACLAGGGSAEPPPPPRRTTEPEPQTELDPLEAAAARLRGLHERDGFTVVVQDPFLVVGDESPALVQRRATNTVGWASARLREAYFDQAPPGPPVVWLFRDDESYRRWAKALWDDEPDTPYGYYSAEHNVLVMNISTGGGTLVHELVHPFIDANFPQCPSWFDEGLASLYEQCGERDGKIVGFENWRLSGLREHIEAGTNPSFDALTHTSREAFYADESGVHYAQARYLCFYLQEHGLLRRYYHAFVAAAEVDPSGYETLKTVLDTRDMKAFQREWERYVLALRFA